MDRNASISQQAQNLKRSLENRQQRRQADKFQRQQESQDVYESRQASSTQPGAASLASLAAISALPAVQQEVIRCELCQANFLTDASWKQHIEGPVHRKALERQEAERVRHERMRQSGLNDVAEMALGAAGWHSQWSADQGRASSSRQPSSRPAGSAPAQTHARPPQHQQQGRTSAHGLSIRQQQQRQHEVQGGAGQALQAPAASVPAGAHEEAPILDVFPAPAPPSIAPQSSVCLADEEDDMCPVCLDAPPNIQVMHCRHVLCAPCAKDLCMRHSLAPALCPYCRIVISGFKPIIS
mmetsp:Transcript_21828/g.60492  ORF Transcript_21828/g.60492 Transcript_21828/m.60492 type:complete len:297 (+) Transcript_21828:62-952(+)